MREEIYKDSEDKKISIKHYDLDYREAIINLNESKIKVPAEYIIEEKGSEIKVSTKFIKDQIEKGAIKYDSYSTYVGLIRSGKELEDIIGSCQRNVRSIFPNSYVDSNFQVFTTSDVLEMGRLTDPLKEYVTPGHAWFYASNKVYETVDQITDIIDEKKVLKIIDDYELGTSIDFTLLSVQHKDDKVKIDIEGNETEISLKGLVKGMIDGSISKGVSLSKSIDNLKSMGEEMNDNTRQMKR